MVTKQTLPQVHGPGSPALRNGRTQIEICRTFPASEAMKARTGKDTYLKVVRTLRFPTYKQARFYADHGIPLDGETKLHLVSYSAHDGWQSHATGTRQADGTWTDSWGNPLKEA